MIKPMSSSFRSESKNIVHSRSNLPFTFKHAVIEGAVRMGVRHKLPNLLIPWLFIVKVYYGVWKGTIVRVVLWNVVF